MDIVLIVVISALGTALLLLLLAYLWRKIVPFLSAVLELPYAMGRLADALERAAAQGGDLGKYIAGFISTCEANVAQYERLTAAVEKFSSVVVAPERKDELTAYDERQADRTYLVQQYMAAGYTKENAETRVAADEAERIFSNNL